LPERYPGFRRTSNSSAEPNRTAPHRHSQPNPSFEPIEQTDAQGAARHGGNPADTTPGDFSSRYQRIFSIAMRAWYRSRSEYPEPTTIPLDIEIRPSPLLFLREPTDRRCEHFHLASHTFLSWIRRRDTDGAFDVGDFQWDD
jgi:hypothetical protein